MDTEQPIAPLIPQKRVTRKKPVGSGIRINLYSDGQLLSLIWNSTFITHRQLVKLAILLSIKSKRQHIEKRIAGYSALKLIKRFPPVIPHEGIVYQITPIGLGVLEAFGLGLCSMTSEMKSLVPASKALDYYRGRASHCALPFLRAG